MFSKAEKAVVKTAAAYILRELGDKGVARIDGLGEFSIKDFTYRDPITKEVAKTKTVRFRPFTAAKRVAKAGLPAKPKKAKAKKSKKVAVPVKKKPVKKAPPTPVEKKKKPTKKSSGFAFTLGKK
jgi:nucleoid DNA-binding protein